MIHGTKRLKELRARIDEKVQLKDGRRAKMYVGTFKESGKGVCVVVRNSQQIFRGGHATLTDANKAGVLCWMMDTTLIPILRDLYGVEYLITLERETGDMWVSSIADWTDPTKLFRLTDPELLTRSYRGSQLSYLPVRHMLHKPNERPILPRAR